MSSAESKNEREPGEKVFHIVMKVLDGTIADAKVFQDALLVNGLKESQFFDILHKETAEPGYAILYALAVDSLVCRFQSVGWPGSPQGCLIHGQQFPFFDSTDSRGVSYCPACKGLIAPPPPPTDKGA